MCRLYHICAVHSLLRVVLAATIAVLALLPLAGADPAQHATSHASAAHEYELATRWADSLPCPMCCPTGDVAVDDDDRAPALPVGLFTLPLIAPNSLQMLTALAGGCQGLPASSTALQFVRLQI